MTFRRDPNWKPDTHGATFAALLETICRLEDMPDGIPDSFEHLLHNCAGDPDRTQTWASRRVFVNRARHYFEGLRLAARQREKDKILAGMPHFGSF